MLDTLKANDLIESLRTVLDVTKVYGKELGGASNDGRSHRCLAVILSVEREAYRVTYRRGVQREGSATTSGVKGSQTRKQMFLEPAVARIRGGISMKDGPAPAEQMNEQVGGMESRLVPDSFHRGN